MSTPGNRGFSLMEMVVACAIGSIVLLIAATVMTGQSLLGNNLNKSAQMTNQKQMDQEILSKYLRMAMPGQLWLNSNVLTALGLGGIPAPCAGTWLTFNGTGGSILIGSGLLIDVAGNRLQNDPACSGNFDVMAILTESPDVSPLLLANNNSGSIYDPDYYFGPIGGVPAAYPTTGTFQTTQPATGYQSGDVLGIVTDSGLEFVQATSVAGNTIQFSTLGTYAVGTQPAAGGPTLPGFRISAGSYIFKPGVYLIGADATTGFLDQVKLVSSGGSITYNLLNPVQSQLTALQLPLSSIRIKDGSGNPPPAATSNLIAHQSAYFLYVNWKPPAAGSPQANQQIYNNRFGL